MICDIYSNQDFSVECIFLHGCKKRKEEILFTFFVNCVEKRGTRYVIQKWFMFLTFSIFLCKRNLKSLNLLGVLKWDNFPPSYFCILCSTLRFDVCQFTSLQCFTSISPEAIYFYCNFQFDAKGKLKSNFKGLPSLYTNTYIQKYMWEFHKYWKYAAVVTGGERIQHFCTKCCEIYHFSDIRGLCLMKWPSETPSKFAIFLEYKKKP